MKIPKDHIGNSLGVFGMRTYKNMPGNVTWESRIPMFDARFKKFS